MITREMTWRINTEWQLTDTKKKTIHTKGSDFQDIGGNNGEDNHWHGKKNIIGQDVRCLKREERSITQNKTGSEPKMHKDDITLMIWRAGSGRVMTQAGYCRRPFQFWPTVFTLVLYPQFSCAIWTKLSWKKKSHKALERNSECIKYIFLYFCKENAHQYIIKDAIRPDRSKNANVYEVPWQAQ